MDYALIVLIQVLYAMAVLVLVSSGLVVILGMMKVINIAQGEFIMLGAFTTVIAAHHGVNLWVAMLVLAPLAAGLFGVITEQVVMRHLYGRMIDSLLATWGLSLFMIGGVTMIFGTTVPGVTSPFGSLSIGAYSTSWYTLFVIAAAAVMLAAIAAVLRFTRLGLVARGTMQNPRMAAGLGLSPARVYVVTFAIGSALAGLAGGILAPVTTVVPSMGAAFISKAFITVMCGGASIVTGTAIASVLFGGIEQVTTFLSTTVWGEAAMLFVAIVMLRVMPQGITGRFFRGSI